MHVANGTLPYAAASLERFAICWQLGCVSTWKSFPVRVLMLPPIGNDRITFGPAVTGAAIFSLRIVRLDHGCNFSSEGNYHFDIFSSLRRKFLFICVTFIFTGNRDECAGAQRTLDTYGGALFRCKWLWLPLSFCKCRMDKTIYNEYICEPLYFWSFSSSLLLHIFFPPLWLLPLPHIIS